MKLGIDPLARTLVRALVAGMPALFLLPATAAAQFQWDCATTPGATACKGDWGPSIELAISCGASPACATAFCNEDATDEIGHAIVVPVPMTVGTTTIEEGSVLLWTRCDTQTGRGGVAYNCHVFDPETRTIVAALPFNLPSDIGPFCSGHVWSLDPAGDPKLLTVGGTTHNECCRGCGTENSHICANGKVYWFDPLVANPVRDGWRDDPPDMPLIDPPTEPIYDQVKLWYPSVITYLEQSGSDFAAISLGGSRIQAGGGCGEPVQLTKWWALFFPFSEWIEYEDPSYEWHQYPRTLLLSDNSILSPSNAVVCQATFPPYGGNPVQRVFPGRALQTHAQGPDPNTQVPPFATEAMHYGNAVILHTLKAGWSWNVADPLAEYDLDRVIVSGGAPQPFVPSFRLTQPHTLELSNATGGSGALWRQKVAARRHRMFGNLVILPDGSLLACGGMDRHPFNHALTQWFSTSERFEPLGPLDLGRWTDLDQREIVGTHQDHGPFATLRGYHSSAVLLRDGRVAIFGGEPSSDLDYDASDSADTVEIFEPPYLFRGPRLRIQSFPETIHYGTTFGITVDNPAKVDRACLIGVGAVTHHFDYGQRYVELMIDKTNPPVGNVEVLMPDLPPLAPEGFYLFFVVDEKPDGFHMPSEGRFVKVTFGT